MEMGEWHNDPDKQAGIYSRVYKEQIADNQSALFAHKYADLIAMGEYSNLYCWAEAKEYEKALRKGYSNDFASIYSVTIAEYIGNNFLSYDEALESSLYKFEKEKIEAKYNSLK